MATPNSFIKGNGITITVKKGDGTAQALAYATNHTMSISPNYIEVQTKDHGDYPGKILQDVQWEITTENLYTDSFEALAGYVNTDAEVTVVIGKGTNDNGTYPGTQYGHQGVSDAGPYTVSDTIATGQAKISSLTLNAQSGDNATYSATFTGTGKLTIGSN